MKNLIGNYVIQKIQELFKESDFEMLMYIKNTLYGLDLYTNIQIEKALESNYNELDTPQYYEKRNALLNTLGLVVSEDGDSLLYIEK